MKYLVLYLAKYLQPLYTGNYQILLRESKADLYGLCSCIGRLNTVMMSFLAKLIYEIDITSIKLPALGNCKLKAQRDTIHTQILISIQNFSVIAGQYIVQLLQKILKNLSTHIKFYLYEIQELTKVIYGNRNQKGILCG